MASEQYSGDVQGEEENTKPSFMKKIKSKAKKLKSKLKPHSSEDSSGQAPAPRDPLDRYTTGSADQDGNESDTSSSSDEAGDGNQHASEGTPYGAVSSGNTGYGKVSNTDDKSSPTVLKSGGPPETQQAIPTNYSYFNADPEQARLPSDIDSSGRQRDVPSTTGGLSAGSLATQNLSGTTSPFSKHDDTLSKSSERDSELPLSSVSPEDSSSPFAKYGDSLSRSADRNSELPLSSVSPEDSSERNDVSLVEPSQSSQDSLLSRPIEQDPGVGDKDNEGYGGLAATAVGGGVAAGLGHKFQKSLSNDTSKNVSSGARSTSDPEVYDRSYTKSEGEGFAPNTTGTAAGAKQDIDSNLNVPSQELTWTQQIYNTLVGAKDTVASHPVTQSVVSYPATQKATETASGLKESAASKLGYADQSVSTDSTPVSEKASDSAVQAKDSATSNLSANDEQKPFVDRVTETGYGVRDAVVSHPVTQTVASKLGYADQANSTDSTPVSQKGIDSAYQVKDSASSNLSADDGVQKPLTDRVTETGYGMRDAVVSHPITQTVASKLGYADQANSTDSTPVSEKVSDSAVQAKDSATSNLSANDEQKPFVDRVTETGYGMRDAVVSHPITQTVASKLGYADQANSTDSTAVSQKGVDSAYQVKDSASSNLSADDGVQKPLTDRLTESAYGLKDTVASHPVTQKAYDWKDTVVSHPVTQKTTDYAVQGKNYAANQLSYADQALSSDDKPVSAKTYETAIQTRDAAVQKTTPDHHDKALADSVTESISNLPALLTSKLGLGGGTTNSPTTASTTPRANVSTFDPSTRKDTPFPDHSAAASPGIMDRVSGLASSLFGGGAKQPTTNTDSEKPASVEKYIP